MTLAPPPDPTIPAAADAQAVWEKVLDARVLDDGLTLRLDSPARALARLAGVLAAAPGPVLGRIAPYLLRWPARLDARHPWRLVARWLRGRARIDYVNIVSHHFMSRVELASAVGQERLALCVFKAPVGDTLVSMCELNALGLRDRYYDGLQDARGGARQQRSHPVEIGGRHARPRGRAGAAESRQA